MSAAYRIRPGELPKRCTCCGLTHSPEQWAQLKPSGKGDGIYRVDGRPELEMRQCDCGSTLAVQAMPVVEVTHGEVLSWIDEVRR